MYPTLTDSGNTATISPATGDATQMNEASQSYPTVAHVENIPETDMTNALSLFERMANSVVSASKLVPMVQGLMRDVEGLKHDIETVREQNSRLDEMLTKARRERDELTGELYNVRMDLKCVTAERNNLKHSAEGDTVIINKLQSDIDTTKAERDEWMASYEKATNELAEANAKLAKFGKVYQELFGGAPKSDQPATDVRNIPITQGGTMNVEAVPYDQLMNDPADFGTAVNPVQSIASAPEPALQPAPAEPKVTDNEYGRTTDYGHGFELYEPPASSRL